MSKCLDVIVERGEPILAVVLDALVRTADVLVEVVASVRRLLGSLAVITAVFRRW